MNKQIDMITELLIDFDEMGFAPTTLCPNPEAYAIEWRKKLTEETERLQKALNTDISIVRVSRGSGKTAHLREVGRIKVDAIRADTVRKMQDAVAVHFGTYTDTDTVKVSDVFRLLGKIAEEMLEGGTDG